MQPLCKAHRSGTLKKKLFYQFTFVTFILKPKQLDLSYFGVVEHSLHSNIIVCYISRSVLLTEAL